jgi:predicted nucleic acid-binding protein
LTVGDQLWTTDAVLTEVLAMFSGAGEYLRQGAARRIRALLSDTRVILVPASHELFLEGLALYEQRPDKAYSLTDCISMQVMRREGLTEVLTNDHHFIQEGFRVLFS